IQEHPDFLSKFANNPDLQNRDLAFGKIFEEVLAARRRQDIEFYKLYKRDEGFQQSIIDLMKWLTDGRDRPRR
ncbi:MAG: hypothetical protein AAGA10_31425, partial [Bacteroidota bacterium]